MMALVFVNVHYPLLITYLRLRQVDYSLKRFLEDYIDFFPFFQPCLLWFLFCRLNNKILLIFMLFNDMMINSYPCNRKHCFVSFSFQFVILSVYI